MNQQNVVCLGRMPLTMTKIQLKILLKEICHLDLKQKSINEYQVGKFKVVFLDCGDDVIPTIAMDRLKKFGKQILNNVVVRRPLSMPMTKNFSLPPQVLTKYGMSPHNTEPLQVALKTVLWLHYELHLKYPQLHKINMKYENTVYEGLRNTITQRVINVMALNNSLAVSSTLELYRKLHPYFGDFELVLSHIATAEKKRRGLPPTDYTAADLMVHTPPPVPEAQKKQLWDKNSKVFHDKVQSYIASLDTEESAEDSPEMVLRKKVRLTMKQISEHLPRMVPYKPSKDLCDTPDWMALYILGESPLPVPKIIKLFLKKHRVEYFDVVRSVISMNAVRVFIPMDQYHKVMELDGCDPQFNQPNLSTTTDIIYIRHTNDPYMKVKYFSPTLKTLQKWYKKIENQKRVVQRKAK